MAAAAKERRQRQGGLGEGEVAFRSLFDAAPLAIVALDRQGRVQRWNPAAEQLFGWSEEEVCGRPLPIVPARRRAEFRRLLARELRGRYPKGIELQRQRRDGSPVVLRLWSAPCRARDGRITGVFGMFVDVTDHKRAEEALRASEERYRAVVEDQTEVISRFRPDGTILFVNEVFCRFFGQDPDRMIGRRWQPRALREDVAHVERQLRLLAPDHPVVAIENRVRDARGRVRWMHFINRAFFDEHGRIEEVQSVGRDITERRRAEAKLQALTARLQSLREEEQRRLARELHDVFGHALTELMYDVAWLSRRLAQRGEGERSPGRRRLAAMARRAETQMRTVRRISGALRPALLDTVGLVPAIQSLAAGFGDRTGLQCRFVPPRRPPALDEQRSTALYRILQELLDNVARHARARTVVVRLRDLGPRGVSMEVRDDGCGLTERDLAKPSALGLLGMRERAGALGGWLDIRGTRGKGTLVCIHLPATPGGR